VNTSLGTGPSTKVHQVALATLATAVVQTQVLSWRQAQETCAQLVDEPLPIGSMARLNILVCEYHLRHTQLIPERALALLPHLPQAAVVACIGLVLLAAWKNDSLHNVKNVALALADADLKPRDLPSVPRFVMLRADLSSCAVAESMDVAQMSEIAQWYLKSEGLSVDEEARFQSLAQRYREHAANTARLPLRVRRGRGCDAAIAWRLVR